MTAETSFLFFPDGLSPGAGLIDVDDERSWNNTWRSATRDVIHATSLSVRLPSHVIFAVSAFLVGAGAGMEVEAGVGPGAVLLPLPRRFFEGIPPLWISGRADMGTGGCGADAFWVFEPGPVLPAIAIGLFVKA